MSAEEALRRFPEQFDWQPVVEHNEALKSYPYYVVCGMGGSHLGAWLIKRFGNVPNITIHRGYGLPALPEELLRSSLIILSSYSGTTEEVLDSGREALKKGLSIAISTTGGKLIEFAHEHALPSVQIPETGLEPRMAVGYSMLSLARLMCNAELEAMIRDGGKAADVMAGKAPGEALAERLKGKIPVVYSSQENVELAFIWKIKFNETSKIPSFMNVFPEMCHNELTGYDVVDSTREISSRIHAIFLDDASDHSRVKMRMQVASDMLGERGIPVEHVPLEGTGFQKALAAALTADWASYALAEFYGVPHPDTPMVAEFKKRITL